MVYVYQGPNGIAQVVKAWDLKPTDYVVVTKMSGTGVPVVQVLGKAEFQSQYKELEADEEDIDCGSCGS